MKMFLFTEVKYFSDNLNHFSARSSSELEGFFMAVAVRQGYIMQ